MVEIRQQSSQATTWQLESERLQFEISKLDEKMETRLAEFKVQLMVDFKKLLDDSIGKVVGSMNTAPTNQGATETGPSASNPTRATTNNMGPEVPVIDVNSPKEPYDNPHHTGIWHIS
ncbi:hypothetical protein HRI_000420900 [Hibiscus trionum]|uniref:Uncharacterized protein n=1 Tax=Hibiscus trionum TaxID=183268 RepID=A0A9W7GZ65_HIBTR|nr:hypothetical protein HRI_000420900 [Hibiscus trionum]